MKREYKYLTNCKLDMERQADYETLKKLKTKFVAVKDDSIEGFDGNLAAHFYIDVKTKKAKLAKSCVCSDDSKIALCEAIPSALVLYRLCAFDEVRIESFGQDGYKCVWHAPLAHSVSGRVIYFGEHKGAFSFWTERPDEEIKDKAFIKDLSDFLTYLVSDEFAHPYDGLVAGSVA